jgi:hypothetical protein
MNINHVTDIYTNLGRLGRDVLKPDQRPEGAANQGQADDNSALLLPVEPRNRLAEAMAQDQGLDLEQAMKLTGTVEEQILETAQRPWSLDFLKVEQVSFIAPRYV